MKDRLYDNADSFAMSFDEEWENIDCEDLRLKIDKVFELLSDHPFLISNPENARKLVEFRIFSLKKLKWFKILVLNIHMLGELKKPLLYKNIVIPIIGPIPKTNRTNFAEFFVCPNSWFCLFDLILIFFDFFFFMDNILLHQYFK